MNGLVASVGCIGQRRRAESKDSDSAIVVKEFKSPIAIPSSEVKGSS